MYTFSRTEKFVAIFITAAVLIVVGGVVFVTANNDLFKQKRVFRTEFNSAKGLKVGMKITLKDFTIGKVRSIELNKENTIDLSIEIYNKYTDRIREDSVLVRIADLFGNSELLLYPGTPETKQLDDSAFLQSSDTEKGAILKSKYDILLAQEGLDGLIESVNDLATSLQYTVDNVVNDPKGELRQTLVNIQEISSEISNSTASEEKGNLNYLLYNPDIRNRTSSILKNVDGSTKEILVITRDANKIVKDVQVMAVGLNQTISNVENITKNVDDATPAIIGNVNKATRDLTYLVKDFEEITEEVDNLVIGLDKDLQGVTSEADVLIADFMNVAKDLDIVLKDVSNMTKSVEADVPLMTSNVNELLASLNDTSRDVNSLVGTNSVVINEILKDVAVLTKKLQITLDKVNSMRFGTYTPPQSSTPSTRTRVKRPDNSSAN